MRKKYTQFLFEYRSFSSNRRFGTDFHNKENKKKSTEFSLKRSHANSRTVFFEDRRIQKQAEAFSSVTPEINKRLFYCFESKKNPCFVHSFDFL